ncbi:alpha-amylase [Cryptococcus bacillisporus CA1873]|uniref:alpha-amylase n=1 Tax=Cryptococcus bacillisporus CA1873 TaxID=1296111 RepID=A0ABR5BDA9_CRYGA|nr:alpha-amylase [Cryptococcus bacillisporus CA1873]|eukprot:KIR67164.1 alpha-amylase [Cryptococcus gattii CA1873]
MRLHLSLSLFFSSLAAISVVTAASADKWKGKSIYQLFTDRFAPVSDTAPARSSPIPDECDPIDQTWCGGTWLSIIDKLDYISDMGFDAIWISPVSQNTDRDTPYHYAYHGYWVNDPRVLNPRFGTADDLKALSKALHDRGMYLMVDIVVNNIPGTTINDPFNTSALVADRSIWTDSSEFHPQCWIDYSNQTSVENCWLGDDKLPLMDVNTENEVVISTLQAWIANLTAEYHIDGLRIDAAKHVPGEFWTGFCGAAGVFCIGEVYTDDIGFAAEFQTQKWMDSILGYPLYYGIVDGFGTPNGNMTKFVDIATQILGSFPTPGLIGNFLENHDLPRWRNTTADSQLAYNAMVVQFLFEGLPVVYYGQEQDFASGAGDPYNRQALWPSQYANTTTYNHIKRLNEIRHAVISNNTLFDGKNFLDSQTKIVASTDHDVAFRKGPLLAVLTNRGSPSQNVGFGVPTMGWPSQSSVVDLLSCKQFTVGSGGAILVSYAASGYGGMPYIFASQSDASALMICGDAGMSSYVSANATSAASPALASSTGLGSALSLPAVVAGTLGLMSIL